MGSVGEPEEDTKGDEKGGSGGVGGGVGVVSCEAQDVHCAF